MGLSKRLALACVLCVSGQAQSLYQFHGYLQGRFTNQEGTSDRLELRRARLSVTGDLLPKLSYAVQWEFAKKPYFLDANLTWRFSKAARVMVGQFKVPFSAESLVADNLNRPIARSRVVNAVVPGRDTGVQGRDGGLQLSGSLLGEKTPRLEYSAAVLRGQTFIYSPNAHYPAVVGRLLYHPRPEWTLGGDGYGSFSSPANREKRRWETEGGYEHGKFYARAEQIWARDGKLERRGGYVVGAVRIHRSWEPLARADWYTTDIHKVNSSSVAYMAGMNFFWKRYLKIGADTGAQVDQDARGASPLFLAQMILVF